MILTGDKRGQTDGPAHTMLQQVKSSVPIVLMSRTPNFVFNDALYSVDKYILVEFSELGWDWNFTETHIWGLNTYRFPQFDSDEYRKFDEFVASKPPLMTFTRELLKKDVTDNHRPVDYPCWYSVGEPVSESEFNNRPISAFYFWGRSHEARVKLHSRMWSEGVEKGFAICDNLSYIDRFITEEKGKKIVSAWTPHYARIEIKNILALQNLSKLSIAMPGAGWKTFRHCEASFNSVMVKWEDNLAWSFDWEHAVNCVEVDAGDEIFWVEAALEWGNLYEIYRNGVETCRKYQIDNYVKYLESEIKKVV